MKIALAFCALLSGAAVSTTSPEPAGRPVFRKSLADGRALIVRRERVSQAPPPDLKKVATQPSTSSSRAARIDSSFLFTFWAADRKSGVEELLWSRRAPDHPLTPGGLEVLDATLEERTLVVAYRMGNVIYGHVIACPAGAEPVYRVATPAVYSDGVPVRVETAAIAGSVADGSLTLELSGTVRGDPFSSKFSLSNGAKGLQWVATQKTR